MPITESISNLYERVLAIIDAGPWDDEEEFMESAFLDTDIEVPGELIALSKDDLQFCADFGNDVLVDEGIEPIFIKSMIDGQCRDLWGDPSGLPKLKALRISSNESHTHESESPPLGDPSGLARLNTLRVSSNEEPEAHYSPPHEREMYRSQWFATEHRNPRQTLGVANVEPEEFESSIEYALGTSNEEEIHDLPEADRHIEIRMNMTDDEIMGFTEQIKNLMPGEEVPSVNTPEEFEAARTALNDLIKAHTKKQTINR